MLFKRPLADWPLILCGPMLRRVRPSSVCVFVALRYPTRVTVTVVGPPGPIASRTADTLAFGAHLHALALDVLIAPADELQPGVLYTYNVEFSYVDAVGSARTTDLASEGMLSSPYRLGYADGALPSFSLPPGLEHLNIVHGSCRKPHAPGVDALAIADAMLAAERTDPLARPHHLLLTGDQIYADDVDASLLASLTDTGEELVGWSSPEELPGSAGGVVPWDPEVRPGIDRGDFAFEQTRFTSTALDTQLAGHQRLAINAALSDNGAQGGLDVDMYQVQLQAGERLYMWLDNNDSQASQIRARATKLRMRSQPGAPDWSSSA